MCSENSWGSRFPIETQCTIESQSPVETVNSQVRKLSTEALCSFNFRGHVTALVMRLLPIYSRMTLKGAGEIAIWLAT